MKINITANLLSEEELDAIDAEFEVKDNNEDRYFLLKIHAVLITSVPTFKR